MISRTGVRFFFGTDERAILDTRHVGGVGLHEITMRTLLRVQAHIEIGPPIPAPVAPEGGRLPRTIYKDHSAQLHAELQRLFDKAMERVPWDYPIT